MRAPQLTTIGLLSLTLLLSPVLRGQYAGGNGDGHDLYSLATALSTFDAAAVYSGGTGDGYDMDLLFARLADAGQMTIFAGGNGDGHDMQALMANLNNYDPGLVFAGGDGDGYDMQALMANLSNYDPGLVFAGGDGDGHDMFSASLLLANYDVTQVFSGGDGDGHDMLAAALRLSNYDATLVFSGGDGDGHDMATFAGAFLPIRLISFEAVPHDKFVLLKWVTADEENSDFYVIERTRSGQAFDPVGQPVTAAGYSEPGERLAYELRDEDPLSGTSYYRLRSVDFDGTFALSELLPVTFDDAPSWDYVVFPNPNAGREVNVRLQGELTGGEWTAELFDGSGRLLLRQGMVGSATDVALSLPKPLVVGQYLLRVTSERGDGRSKVLVVGRR